MDITSTSAAGSPIVQNKPTASQTPATPMDNASLKAIRDEISAISTDVSKLKPLAQDTVEFSKTPPAATETKPAEPPANNESCEIKAQEAPAVAVSPEIKSEEPLNAPEVAAT